MPPTRSKPTPGQQRAAATWLPHLGTTPAITGARTAVRSSSPPAWHPRTGTHTGPDGGRCTAPPAPPNAGDGTAMRVGSNDVARRVPRGESSGMPSTAKWAYRSRSLDGLRVQAGVLRNWTTSGDTTRSTNWCPHLSLLRVKGVESGICQTPCRLVRCSSHDRPRWVPAFHVYRVPIGHSDLVHMDTETLR